MLSKYLAALLLFCSTTACAQDAQRTQDSTTGYDPAKRAECSEIAHRISCNLTGDCRAGATAEEFERRLQAELMIAHICTDGPSKFGEYWWIDVHGQFRPYYEGLDGKKSKFPPPSR